MGRIGVSAVFLFGCEIVAGLPPPQLRDSGVPGSGGRGGVSVGDGGTGGGAGIGGAGNGTGGAACPIPAPCRGADLRGATCDSAVALGWVGSLGCTADCQLDTSGCAAPPATYSALDDTSKWVTFDLRTVHPAAHSYIGAMFDGRQYIYFPPYGKDVDGPNGSVVRLDTRVDFESRLAWSTYDVSSKNPAASAFIAGAFDGSAMYFTSSGSGLFARYDLTAAGGFGSDASWTIVDVSAFDPAVTGLEGGAFDGRRYVYFTPVLGVGTRKVVRYDSWQACESIGTGTQPSCDLATTAAPGGGFSGAIFDGQYIYFPPTARVVARYDTKGLSFGSSSSWRSFDLIDLGLLDEGYSGGVFDGRYVYFVPYQPGTALRLDTQGDFNDTRSWKVFHLDSLGTVTGRYSGGTFDGRFIYFAPYTTFGPASQGIIVRYDSATDRFDDPSSWSKLDLTSVSQGASGFSGATFDGQYVYLAPTLGDGNIVARFDAKSPRSLPRQWNASFF
jgi:hypothetical protein